MADGYFRIKVEQLVEERNTNLHKVAQRGAVSYPTIHRYMRHPEQVRGVSLRVLYGLLIRGLDISPEDLEEMRFGDIFEIVHETDEPEEK